ncbi:uncharacterized protein N7446_000650 [Penicillium canescens]|uniref:uncharacterized protein n=1 Tax=Penicillium canescens TaxID=5083 RepID=UPI0026DF4803|nr:uncharacterized protein N7446_000650 [Penicillium canescens]KAJ6077714.1 hypothetical protein N7446_000650 [Penicillium canescens]
MILMLLTVILSYSNYIGRQTSIGVKKTGDVITSGFSRCERKKYRQRQRTSSRSRRIEALCAAGLRIPNWYGCNLQRFRCGSKDTEMILGLGAVGMGAFMLQDFAANPEYTQTAKIRNCENVVVVDRIESLLQHAKNSRGLLYYQHKRLGLYKTERRGFGLGSGWLTDTAGVAALIEDSLRCTRKRGKLVLIGVPPLGYALDIDAVEHISQ